MESLLATGKACRSTHPVTIVGFRKCKVFAGPLLKDFFAFRIDLVTLRYLFDEVCPSDL